MRTLGIALVAGVLATAWAVPVTAGPGSHAACPDAGPATVFASGLGQVENMIFDGRGHLYVTSLDGKLYSFTPDGRFRTIVDVDVPLGGIALDRRGRLYVGAGVGVAVPAPVPSSQGPPYTMAEGSGQVWRFSSIARGRWTVYADELDSVNGMAIDARGNMYVSEGFDEPIVRIPPGGNPEPWGSAQTPNGLEVTPDGRGLYVAVTPQSRIVRIELADPTQVSTVAELVDAQSPPPKLPDDLGVGPGDALYVAGHAGDVMRVNTTTGKACLLAGGQEPTAAVVASGFGRYNGAVFVTDFNGTITVIRDGLSR